MIAALFGGQPHLVQRLLTVNNDFAAVFKADGQHAAVDFAVDVAIAVPVVQTFFDGHPQAIGQAMEFTVVHNLILLFLIFEDGSQYSAKQKRAQSDAKGLLLRLLLR